MTSRSHLSSMMNAIVCGASGSVQLPFSWRVGRPRRHSRPPRPPRTPIAHGGRAGQTSGGGGNRQSVPLVMVKRPDLGGRAFAWHPFVSGVAVRFSFSAFFRF
ncbi:Hypothetical protein NTJ_10609 [Nesidiocoris tenuis]|uniref:Uncharacterized protein n=1 Tax=Nesidiocoris tenuis TaxID=355587 RepID=A0ABN7B3P7_9HEMI|nr:Hypothetical protein NTJ_10609 [Nesidiocoris tenuis]